LVADCHAVGLGVHPWTFRAEKRFLPAGLDLEGELREFFAAGVDGVFADQPDVAVRMRDAVVTGSPERIAK
jgi:glycerophosphoryl diester phosphodiesterase